MNGITQLGYLAFEVSKPEAWESFAVGVIGMAVEQRLAGGGFTLRMDGHRRRFFVTPGPADDLTLVGWQTENAASLAELAAKLMAAGYESKNGTPAELAQRGVQGLITFTDPSGIPSEIYYGPEMAAGKFISPLVASGFVADDLGFGHLVLSAEDQKRSEEFYLNVLGFKLSDTISAVFYGFKADLTFLHVNPRHHSLALGGKQKKRVHHIMFQARSLSDVGMAMDRTLKSGLRIMHTLGRHPNDKMISFYGKTPSGFQFEFGCDGREIDDRIWQPQSYDRISEWGHHPPEALATKKPAATPV